MSWQPEVFVERKWTQNGLVFATEQEATGYASNLFMRWTMCEDSRAVEVDAPVTHTYVDGRLEKVKSDA